MVTGANEDDWHLRGVDVARDIDVTEWLDLRRVELGEGCPACGAPLAVEPAIEVGHIFKLGTKYSEALGAKVLDEHGEERVIWMGSYGIGVGRNVAAIVEVHHDDKGIVWPVSVAPWEVVVTVVKVDDEASMTAAERIYEELAASGVDVIIDDRDERPGVKFTDAELVGMPYRVTVGPKALADGMVEVTDRRTSDTERVAVDDVVGVLAGAVAAQR